MPDFHGLLQDLLPVIGSVLLAFGAKALHAFALQMHASAWSSTLDTISKAADAAVASVQQTYIPEMRQEDGKLPPEVAACARDMALKRATELAGKRALEIAAKHGVTIEQLLPIIEASVLRMKSVPPLAPRLSSPMLPPKMGGAK